MSPSTRLVAGLLFLALVAAAPSVTARSERVPPEVAVGVLLSDLKPALTARDDVNQVQLLPIGFSGSGRFAWLRAADYPEVGGLVWQVFVQDLETDEVVARVDGVPSESVTTPAEAVESRRGELLELLLGQGFDDRAVAGRGPALKPLPYIRHDDGSNAAPDHGQDDVLTVEVQGSGEGRYGVRLRSSRRGVKTIGQVEAYVGGPTPIGVLQSPLEHRIAVVLQYAVQPLHGADPRILDFAILGAHLETGFTP